MFQLLLFKRLPIPRDAVPWRRRSPCRNGHGGALPSFVQLVFVFRLRALESDRDTEFDYPRRSVVAALSANALASTAPRTVFDLPSRPLTVATLGFGGTGSFDGKAARVATKLEVAEGVTRIVGAAFPARWTAEDYERERARRARQRPPKPTKGVKTRSAKLQQMIGVDDGD
jgi:hypothetical protein